MDARYLSVRVAIIVRLLYQYSSMIGITGSDGVFAVHN